MMKKKINADLCCIYNLIVYLCKRFKESWQSERMRRTRNSVYPFRVSGV